MVAPYTMDLPDWRLEGRRVQAVVRDILVFVRRMAIRVLTCQRLPSWSTAPLCSIIDGLFPSELAKPHLFRAYSQRSPPVREPQPYPALQIRCPSAGSVHQNRHLGSSRDLPSVHPNCPFVARLLVASSPSEASLMSSKFWSGQVRLVDVVVGV